MLDYGLTLAGWDHAWFCESDEWRRGILRKRWPGVPVYSDVRRLAAPADAECSGRDGREDQPGGNGAERPPSVGAEGSDQLAGGGHVPAPVTLLAGGFPCKGISSAGKRAGFGHPETVLWREQLRIIRAVRPRYVLVENVAALLSLHGGECFREVLAGLAESGFDCWWDCLRASDVGAPHRRERVFIVGFAADTGGARRKERDRSLAARSEVAADHACSPADPEREPVELRRRPGGLGEAPTGGSGAPRQQRPRQAAPDSPQDRFDFGIYTEAVHRWEGLLGREAPPPLVERVHGVDARAAARVERSRLSSHGDGVQVQLGELLGRMIAQHAKHERYPNPRGADW